MSDVDDVTGGAQVARARRARATAATPSRTACSSCGRELAGVYIPGEWTCGACIDPPRKDPAMIDADRDDLEVVDSLEAPPAPPPALVDDGLGDLRRYWKQGEWLALIGEPGRRGDTARGAVALWWAAELNLSPLAARLIIVGRDGRIQVGAELLRALAHREGYRVLREGSTDLECTAVLVRGDDDSEVGRCTYRIEQAERAGLTTKQAWQRHPEDMLWARASARVIKDSLPNIATGLEDAEGYVPARVVDRRVDFDYTGEVDDDAPVDGGYIDGDDDLPM